MHTRMKVVSVEKEGEASDSATHFFKEYSKLRLFTTPIQLLLENQCLLTIEQTHSYAFSG